MVPERRGSKVLILGRELITADLADRLQAALGHRYTVERTLGMGGMATVFLARDVKHDRPVAVKVLRPELLPALGGGRFLQEVRITARLTHPHILPLLDSGEGQGLLYYVMPYVEGESLRERLDRETQLPVEDAIRIAREVAGALDYAHGRDVVHRDIKPGNILLEAGHAVVADFGIARAITAAGHEHRTELGIAVGTPAYMSPEQAGADRDLDGRTDLYALGCVLFEMLAGEPPFAGPNAQAILARHALAPIPTLRIVRPGIPEHVEAAIRRALAKVAADRFGSCGDFAAALQRTGGDTPWPGEAPGPSVAAGDRSIAVLPFTNMSADPENEYFCDGITEDILNALTKITGLRVTSRTSSFTFKEGGHDIREIGQRLNVGTVLEGSVRRAANQLRITAQLIDVTSGYHLWSEQYDRKLEDVFAIQDEISRAIAGTLKVRLTATRAENMVTRQTDNLEAYHLYLKGRHLWNRRGAGLYAARQCFADAVALDPSYAAAHSALADTHALLGFYRCVPPAEAFPAAKAAARTALRLDDRLAEAHTSLAFVHMISDWAWEPAELAFRRAMELNPGYATAHHWYAEYLMARGRAEEAIAHSERALALDPLGLIIHVLISMAYYFARRFEEAVTECRKTLDMEPTFTPTFIWLGLSLIQLGRHDEATSAFQQQLALSPDGPATHQAYVAMALAHAGRKDEARHILDALVSLSQTQHVSPMDLAAIHLALGAPEEAMSLLQRAHDERAPWLVWLAADPYWDQLRGDTRFAALVDKLGLA